jgi:UDP-glucose 4-epimerase
MTATRNGRAGQRTTRAIVTGGAGFIGSNLVDRLVAEGVIVLVIDDLSTGRHEQVAAEASLERLDIAIDDLDPLFTAWRPEVVYHLAAQANVVLSARDPLRDLEVNVGGTQRVAAAAHLAGTARLVFVSSGGAVYGETVRPAGEDALPAPVSYYGIHKLAAEGHVRLAGPPSAIARPSNVYGPRQVGGLEGAVVATFVQEAARDGSLAIHGDGSQTRDFIHVRDVADALWRLGQLSVPPGTWNVATGRRTTITELADLVERLHGRTLGRDARARRPDDVTNSAMRVRRLRTLGWRPRVQLADGIAELLREAAARPEVHVHGRGGFHGAG